MHAQGGCSSNDAYYVGCPQGSEGSFWTWLCVKHPLCYENPFIMCSASILELKLPFSPNDPCVLLSNLENAPRSTAIDSDPPQ